MNFLFFKKEKHYLEPSTILSRIGPLLRKNLRQAFRARRANVFFDSPTH